MNSRPVQQRTAHVTLWGVAVLAIVSTAWSARWTPKVDAAERRVTLAPALAPSPDAAALTRWREQVVARDLFRLVRRPSPLPFGMTTPEQSAGYGVPSPSSAKPVLLLRGIMGAAGAGWEAVVEGVPGRERGIVVRAGDVISTVPGSVGMGTGTATLRVREVSAGGVVITGMDTTWRLRVGPPGLP